MRLARSMMVPYFGVLCFTVAAASAYCDSADRHWPTWRGPDSNGVALDADPPITWSETENIKWKVELPGLGQSTPIIWGNKLFIQTAVPTAEEPETQAPERPPGQRRGPPRGPTPTVPYSFNIMCLDRGTGEVLWERTAREEIPHEGHHPTGSFAAFSPVTDGELLWASFGSRGLHCYDLDGNHKWSRDLVQMTKRMTFGEGSSPAIAGDAIIVVLDHESGSKISAFNKYTGDVIWETEREEHTTWATPLPVQVGRTLQVITSATRLIRSYDAKNGELIWECRGQTLNAIPSPVVGFGNVYCTSGFRGNALQAIKLGPKGDLSGTDAIVWQVNKDTPYVASPLLYDDKLYVTSGLRAVLSCYKAETGEALYVGQKLEGLKQIYASPVGAGGRIYIADRSGNTMVVKHGDSFEVLAINTLDKGFDASPVIVGGDLYLRSNTPLYCIAES